MSFIIENSVLISYKEENGIQEVVIPNSVTSIERRAFFGCKTLKSIIISDTVTSIGDFAFFDCSNLKSITISGILTSIGDYAFHHTPWFEEKIKEEQPFIINNTLICGKNCKGSVIIPDTVTSIKERAFFKCKNLKSIVIPDSVTSIEEMTFYGCSKLKNVIISESVTSIERDAFYNTPWFEEQIKENSLFIFKNILICGENCKGSIVIPNTVNTIARSAFYGCKDLTDIIIPNSVKSVEDFAFWGCTNLKSIAIPNSVTSIGEKSFDKSTIQCKANSFAYEYCKQNHLNVEVLE